MQKIKQFVKNYIPIFTIISFSLALVFWILLEISKANPAFAEFVSSGLGGPVRSFFGTVSSILPFSLAEIMIILIPLAITTLIIYGVKVIDGRRCAVRLILTVLSVLMLIYPIYVVTLGAGYHERGIASRLEITADNPDENELYTTMMKISYELEELVPAISYNDRGASVTKLTPEKISEEICKSYERVCEKYPNLRLDIFNQRAKPVILSKGMTQLELLGIYTFFTGESNVNVHYPDYTLPFSIAHEFAHARGVSRENEANFIAFLVCINADDPYIKYSGYMNMYEYLAAALSKADKNMLKNVYAMSSKRVTGEIRAYSEFYYANQNKLFGELSDFINDLYLKSQGTEGIISYGLVVRLCVGYYEGTQ